MRSLFVVLLLAGCGSGGPAHRTFDRDQQPFPTVNGVLVGADDAGGFEVGVLDLQLDVYFINPGMAGEPGLAEGTLIVSGGGGELPISGTYSAEGELDLAGSGYELHQQSDVGNFDGPYTGPATRGGFAAMSGVSERHCGTVAGDETGVMAFAVGFGQARLVIATEARRSIGAGDIHAGEPETLTIDGPEKLHLDGTRQADGSFVGTWQARDQHGTWETSTGACPR